MCLFMLINKLICWFDKSYFWICTPEILKGQMLIFNANGVLDLDGPWKKKRQKSLDISVRNQRCICLGSCLLYFDYRYTFIDCSQNLQEPIANLRISNDHKVDPSSAPRAFWTWSTLARTRFSTEFNFSGSQELLVTELNT